MNLGGSCVYFIESWRVGRRRGGGYFKRWNGSGLLGEDIYEFLVLWGCFISCFCYFLNLEGFLLLFFFVFIYVRSFFGSECRVGVGRRFEDSGFG